MIIGLSGYAKSGKDTVAEMIQEMQPNEWEIRKFSGKLKQIASLLTGIPAEKFDDQEFKESNLGSEWDRPWEYWHRQGDDSRIAPMTVREFLQKLGTDAVRDGLHTNAWVNALMADYKAIETPLKAQGFKLIKVTMPNWIITDCRFPNEAEAIKDKGGIIVRIDRTGIAPVNAHPSETALDNWDFDYKIANVSDLVSLKQSVELLLNII